jgi:hypothetical protein
MDLHASREPYDDMPEGALRAELARQAELLVLPDSTVIKAGPQDAGASDDTTANSGDQRLPAAESPNVDQ